MQPNSKAGDETSVSEDWSSWELKNEATLRAYSTAQTDLPPDLLFPKQTLRLMDRGPVHPGSISGVDGA